METNKIYQGMKQITIFGKVVGRMRPDRVFVTERREEHIFRKFNGLGMSYNVLEQLRGLHCRLIIILLHRDNNTTEKYIATPSDFLEHGEYWKDGQYDNQRILSFKYMTQQQLDNLNAFMEGGQ